MRTVVSDTGPINYLMLIGHIDILPVLFANVVVPVAVREELRDPEAPAVVRSWIAQPPVWLAVRNAPSYSPHSEILGVLDVGERETITLAANLATDTLLLIDERAAVNTARRIGMAVTGTLGVLQEAAKHGLLDLPNAFDKLRRTSFYCSDNLLRTILARYKAEASS